MLFYDLNLLLVVVDVIKTFLQEILISRKVFSDV